MVSRVHPGQSFDNVYSPLIMPFVALREYLSALSTGPVHTEQLPSLSRNITGQWAGEPQINGEHYLLTGFISFVNSHKLFDHRRLFTTRSVHYTSCNMQWLNPEQSCAFFFLKRSTLSQSQLVSAQLNHSLLPWPPISFTAAAGD